MAFTFPGVIQQVLNELGAVKGATATDADANFTAAPSISTVIGPDFLPAMVQPALAGAIGKIVECIAATPHHPERQRFADVTASLANRDALPQAGSGGGRIIGVYGFVRDASDGIACEAADLDRVRGYTRFASTIYSNQEAYLYCINGNRIEHTRPNVVIEVCTYTRPTLFTGDVPLEDWHEPGVVAGTVRVLATKESMFADLYAAANTRWEEHLTETRNLGNPASYGKAVAVPSST